MLDQYPIHLAIHKHGKENFYYEVLESNVENYDEREKYWISYYNSISPNGYNILAGGDKNPVFYGETHPRNTLSNETMMNIIEELLYTNHSQREIARTYSTTERVVNSITAGTCHRQQNLQYPLRMKGCHFSKQTFEEIIWLLQNSNASLQSIANYYNLTKGAVAQINRGNSHNIPELLYPLRKEEGICLSQEEITKLLVKKENTNAH